MKATWTTQKGAKIEVNVTSLKVAVEKEINADGDKVIVIKNEWQYTLNSLIVNGKSFDGQYNSETISFNMSGKIATIIVPIDTRLQINAEEMAEFSTEMKLNEEYENHHNAVKKAMSY